MYTHTSHTPERLAATDKFFALSADMPPIEKTFALLLAKAYAEGMSAQKLLSAQQQKAEK